MIVQIKVKVSTIIMVDNSIELQVPLAAPEVTDDEQVRVEVDVSHRDDKPPCTQREKLMRIGRNTKKFLIKNGRRAEKR